MKKPRKSSFRIYASCFGTDMYSFWPIHSRHIYDQDDGEIDADVPGDQSEQECDQD